MLFEFSKKGNISPLRQFKYQSLYPCKMLRMYFKKSSEVGTCVRASFVLIYILLWPCFILFSKNLFFKKKLSIPTLDLYHSSILARDTSWFENIVWKVDHSTQTNDRREEKKKKGRKKNIFKLEWTSSCSIQETFFLLKSYLRCTEKMEKNIKWKVYGCAHYTSLHTLTQHNARYIRRE